MTELSILLVAILMLVAALIAAMVYMAKKVGGKGEKELRSVTRLLFLTTQIAALVWVSYLIALYATVQLGQPFPIVELSQQAITTILGVNVLKVVENIFEHNDGAVFGRTDKNRQDTD